MKKEPRISVRVSVELKRRIQQVERDTHLDEPNIVRAAVEAVCDYVEKNGGLFLPLEIGPKAKAEPTSYRISEQSAALNDKPEKAKA